MARYREKTEDEKRWNRIRRRLTRELDTQIADWREEALDVLLTGAFAEYNKALETGTKLDLEPQYAGWISKALSDVIELPVPSRD